MEEKEIPHFGYVLGPSSVLQSDQSSSRVPSETTPSQERGPAFLLPLTAVLGYMDRRLFVLPILRGVLALKPVLVLLAVGHGGSFEGLGFLL